MSSLIKSVENVFSLKGYSGVKMHKEMLQDRFIMKRCQEFITRNEDLFKDKVVLDMGCGTGILSLYVASKGASAVIGIEPTNLAESAKEVSERNNFKNVIHIVQARVEDISALPEEIESVDVIVCQWMGYLLFDKSLLDQLLKARNRWLVKEGYMFPDNLKLYLTAAQHGEEESGRRHFVVGDMSDEPVIGTPKLEPVSSDNVLTDVELLRELKLKSIQYGRFPFQKDYELIVSTAGEVTAFVAFFDVGCSGYRHALLQSSSPFDPNAQLPPVVFYLDDPLMVKVGERLTGNFSMKRHDSNSLQFRITVQHTGYYGRTSVEKLYHM